MEGLRLYKGSSGGYASLNGMNALHLQKCLGMKKPAALVVFAFDLALRVTRGNKTDRVSVGPAVAVEVPGERRDTRSPTVGTPSRETWEEVGVGKTSMRSSAAWPTLTGLAS